MFRRLIGVVLAATLAACASPPLKKPTTIPLMPKGGAYRAEGKRLMVTSPGFVVAAEPMDGAATAQFLKESAGLSTDPFHVPGGPQFQVFRVTVANLGKREDLAFHALYATLDSQGRYLYHIPPAEVARDIGGFFPDVDLERVLEPAVFDATTMVNPRHYVSRLLVFQPNDPKARALTLAFSNVGVGNAQGEVLLPFEVVDEHYYQGGPTPPLAMPAELKLQKD